MYKVDLPVDPFKDAAVERRRTAEAARKGRVFNTRLRVMGLDVDALNRQVQEKQRQKSLEKQTDLAYDKLRNYHEDLLLRQDANDKEKRAALEANLTNYRATSQRQEDSRDADLNRGLQEALHFSLPESQLGLASMRRLQRGGAEEEEKRRKLARERERDLRKQMEDNEIRLSRDKHREMLESRELVYQDQKWIQQAEMEDDLRKATDIALNNYNQALAAEQAAKLSEQHRREENENLTEKLHILTSDMMTETGDKLKGMSLEQQGRFYKDRDKQCLQNQRSREAEKMQDAAWERQLLHQSRAAEEVDRREVAERRDLRAYMDRYNVQLAGEQQAYQEYLNKKLYTNRPTRDYFFQFNTSSR